MKACIDEFEPNTSQANYSEGFWRIKSQINAKIEVSGPYSGNVLLKRSEIRPSELFAFKVSLILVTTISEFMFACF